MHDRMKIEMIAAFETGLRKEERSKATIEKYRRDLNAFFGFLPKGKQITKENVISYKEHLITIHAASSVNSMLAAVNGFLAFMGWTEYRVKPVRTQRKVFCSKEKELTKQEYMRLLEAAQKKGNERLCLLMETICSTGIRVSELCFITVKSLYQGRVEVLCKGKNRTVFLPRKLCQKLKRYVGQEGLCSGSVFVTRSGRPLDRSNIWNDMKSLCDQADVARSKVFPHNLRHLFARTYYSLEKDLGRLADLLGHSNVETTRIYTISTGAEQERQVASLGLVL